MGGKFDFIYFCNVKVFYIVSVVAKTVFFLTYSLTCICPWVLLPADLLLRCWVAVSVAPSACILSIIINYLIMCSLLIGRFLFNRRVSALFPSDFLQGVVWRRNTWRCARRFRVLYGWPLGLSLFDCFGRTAGASTENSIKFLPLN